MSQKINDAIEHYQKQHNEEFEKEARELRRHDLLSMNMVSERIERLELVFYARHAKQPASPALQKAIDAVQQYNRKKLR